MCRLMKPKVQSSAQADELSQTTRPIPPRSIIMSRLEGKRTLITGGTSGIGLETARQFIAEGARVAVTSTNPKTIEEAHAALGDKALILRVDAADAAAQAGLAKTVADAFGGIDAV